MSLLDGLLASVVLIAVLAACVLVHEPGAVLPHLSQTQR